MKKILKSILFSFVLVMVAPLSSNAAGSSNCLADTLAVGSASTVDSLGQKMRQMENHIAQLEESQEQAKTWKRHRYWKIGIASPSVKRTDGEEMDWKTDFSVFVQRGKTSYLHSKPIDGMVKFGIDWGFIDLAYSKLKLKDMTVSGETCAMRATRASDGFGEIVSGDPDGNVASALGIKLGMHKIDYAWHVGPSVSVNPWNKLIATAYFHVMPTASGIVQNSCFAYGFGCATSAGVAVAYKAISVGCEGVWSTIKYKQTSFDGNDDEDYDDDGDKSMFDTEKFKLKQSTLRFYIAFRL